MHDRIIGLYDETADAWDEIRSAGLAPNEIPHIDAFAEALSPGAAILDIGCGGGAPVAARLIAKGFAVTGIDSSPNLIALARRRFPQAEWRVADMRCLALGRRFDALLAWHSFFHLAAEDQRAMFPIFAAHAAPGALLLFTSGTEAGEAIGEWQGEPLYHASLASKEYCALLADNGFEVVSFRTGEPAGVGPAVWLARQINPASGLDGSA